MICNSIVETVLRCAAKLPQSPIAAIFREERRRALDYCVPVCTTVAEGTNADSLDWEKWGERSRLGDHSDVESFPWNCVRRISGES